MSGAEPLSDDRIGKGEDSTVDHNTKKFWFKDRSDDSFTNMVVDSSPVSRVSWKDKLLGGSVSNSLDGAANLDLEFEYGDICRSNLNGILAIDFSDHITKILIKGMKLIVVVKLFGRNIVQPWTVDFDPSRPFPCGVLAWIRFPGKDSWTKTNISKGNLMGSRFKKLSSMDSESLTPNLEMPYKVLGTARFIQGDFIKNMKGKEIEKGSGLVVMVNLDEGLFGRIDDCGLSIESGPHSALGLPQKCNGSSLERLGSQRHPKAKVGLSSNALDPKKHTFVTFQEKLDNKSKPKVRANPSNILKAHGAESKKGNGHSGKSLFKSIRVHRGKFKPASSL
ncbi:hypothetical protein Gogos_020829 [Gossypium gossypioides]|uniref:DUF4283 domain-containing protein n=1 Tax=Gossypium gossypioides TaxID=34282 RepID=A0A7J9D016_GOSGO|nr:hypothetical protein [Gossypium gossypioides]